MLAAHGFPVEEITGGCFCCRFNSLVDAAERPDRRRAARRLHRRAGRQLHRPARHGELPAAPDVRRRLQRRAAQRARRSGARAARPRRRAGPLVHAPRCSTSTASSSRKPAIIVINKVDAIEPARIAALRAALAREYPTARVFEVSARTGQGLDAWFDALTRDEADDATPTSTSTTRSTARARRCSAGSTPRSGSPAPTSTATRSSRDVAARIAAALERRRHRDRAPEDDAGAGRRRRRSRRAQPGAQRARAPSCRTRSTASCRAAS